MAAETAPPAQIFRGSHEGADCAACPMARDGQPFKPVYGEGPANPLWIVLGMEPGGTEIATGRPFTGQSGMLVERALARRKRPRSDIWVTNSALCWRPGASDGARRTAARCCAPRLEKELAHTPGLPILALGATAGQTLLGDSFAITERSGTLHRTEFGGGHDVIPSTHPAAMLHGGGASKNHAPDLAFWSLMFDIGKVDAMALGKPIIFGEVHGEDYDFEGRDPARAELLVEYIVQEIRRAKAGACDTETYVEDPKRHHALQPLNAKIRAISLATPQYAISVSWFILTPRAKRLIAAILGDRTIKITFHNGLYDRPILRRHGMPVRGPWGDTLLMHHSAFPGLAHDLQTVTAQFKAVTPWKSEHRDQEETLENLLIYSAKDALATARDVAPLEAVLDAYDARRTYVVDLAMAEIAEDMHDVGVLVSPEVNKALRDQFSAAMKKAREQLEAKVYAPGVLEKIWTHLAFEQAKTQRRPGKKPEKWDPPDFESRIAKRYAELEKAYVKVITKGPDAGKPHPKRWKWSFTTLQVIAYLKVCGVALTQLTATGKISTKKEFLQELRFIPEVNAILSWKENQKLLSTFVIKLLDRQVGTEIVEPKSHWYALAAKADKRSTRAKKPEHRDRAAALAEKYHAIAETAPDEQAIVPKIKYGFADHNGRIHPRWSVHKITGRWGAEDPNFMNVPKADKRTGRPNLRAQFIAPPGKLFVGFDFAQLEARIIALLSGDPWLVNIFAEGKDVHMEFARIVFPGFDNEAPEIRKVLRDQVKRLEFGGFYGGTADGLWKKVVPDVPTLKVEDVQRALTFMQRAMLGVTAWHQRLFRKVGAPPYELRSAINGRRRCFPLGQADESDVKNFEVQSTGADIMDLALLALHPHLKRVYRNAFMICQVHDSATVECLEANAEAIQADVKRLCTQEHELNGNVIRFPVDCKVGKDLASV